MQKKTILGLITGLLILTLFALPLLTACEEEVIPPSEEEEEEQPGEEEEEEGDWWDEFGEPQYGGTLIIPTRAPPLEGPIFDPSKGMGGTCYYHLEGLFGPDLTVDPDIWNYQMGWIPMEYMTGWLAESWEQTDPMTVTVYLRQGVHWQDKEPVNGRELTADDVQYSYDWLLGTGSGFTEPNVFWTGAIPNIERVVATEKYTVQFHLNTQSAMAIYQILEGQVNIGFPIVPHEWVEQGDLESWEKLVSTGPWVVTDFVSGTSVTFSRNPDYWGYDERHPENQLPYLDAFKLLQMADTTTILSALRSGQIGMISDPMGYTWQNAQSLYETNPEIQQATIPFSGYSLLMRCDREPFTDIRVRKALQMAIDRELIAETHYGGTVDGTPTGVTNPIYEGWCTPYDEWPAELQAEYSYNPERARELLAEAAQDGVFEPNEYAGFDTNVITIAGFFDTDLLLILQQQLLDIGVDMDIRTMDPASYMSYASAGEHDQMVYGSGMSMHYTPERAVRFYLSTNTKDNYTFNNDPDYDSLVEQFQAASTIDEAKSLAIEAEMYALAQHWAVNVCGTFPPAVFWQPWVKGYSGQLIIPSLWPQVFLARLWIED